MPLLGFFELSALVVKVVAQLSYQIEPDIPDFENLESTKMAKQKVKFSFVMNFFETAPRTSLAGLQSTVTALPCTHYKTEELD